MRTERFRGVSGDVSEDALLTFMLSLCLLRNCSDLNLVQGSSV